MGEMITKPDANPILYAALNFLVLGCVGYFIMGQSGKGVAALVYTLLLSCLGLSPIMMIITAIDAYQLGQKLQAGESIGEKENGLSFLNSLPGFK